MGRWGRRGKAENVEHGRWRCCCVAEKHVFGARVTVIYESAAETPGITSDLCDDPSFRGMANQSVLILLSHGGVTSDGEEPSNSPWLETEPLRCVDRTEIVQELTTRKRRH